MASTLRKKRVGYMASGGGSTVASVHKAEHDGDLYGVTCGLVISSEPDAGVIKKAQQAGIPDSDIVIISRRDFQDQTSFGQAIIDECVSRDIELVCQFGWLPYTPRNVLDHFSGCIINQHPGALDPTHATHTHPHPDFGGSGMHGLATIAAGVFFARMTGRKLPIEATTHHVGTKLDGGAIIARAALEFGVNEKPKDVQARLLPIEHRLQISVLQHYGRFGKLPAWHREPPLIYDDELPVLEQAKRAAIEYVRELERAA